jgi:hypothetical protein
MTFQFQSYSLTTPGLGRVDTARNFFGAKRILKIAAYAEVISFEAIVASGQESMA